jgi:hypothetical protein
MERRMPGVQHPIEVTTSPARRDIEANLERLGQPQECRDGDLSEMAAFDARNPRLRDPGSTGNVDLPPALPDPNRPKHRTQPDDVHVLSMPMATYRLVTAQLFGPRLLVACCRAPTVRCLSDD